MSNLDSYGTEKALVWQQVGNEFKQKDSKRIFAIAQKNPDYFLYTLYNEEMDLILKELFKIDVSLDNKAYAEKIESCMERIKELNEIHNSFMELNKYLTQSEDILSTGSFLTSERKKQNRLAGIVTVENQNEETEVEK